MRRSPRPASARRWRLTPWGWVLSVALVVLGAHALVVPSPAVITGLIVVVAVWAGLLASSFPSSRLFRMPLRDGAGSDLGGEAARKYEREHGLQ